MAKYCKRCGMPILEGDKKCNHCGLDVSSFAEDGEEVRYPKYNPCPVCGTAILEGDTECSQCHTPVKK